MNQSESYCSNTYRSYASTPRPVEHIYRADSPSVLRRPGKQVYYSPSQAWGQVPHAADHPHLDSTSGYQQQSARHPYQHRQCMTPQQPRQLHPYHPQYQYHHQAAVQDHAAGWVSQQSCMSITQKDLEEVFHCVRFNRMDVLERLLGRGVPVNIRDSYGNTPLMIACQVGSRRIAKTLLRRGADINATNVSRIKLIREIHYRLSKHYITSLIFAFLFPPFPNTVQRQHIPPFLLCLWVSVETFIANIFLWKMFIYFVMHISISHGLVSLTFLFGGFCFQMGPNLGFLPYVQRS